MDWRDWFRTVVAALAQGGVDNPPSEAALLLEWASGQSFAGWTVNGGDLTQDIRGRVNDAVLRRAHGEPFSYIIGHREFYGLDLEVTPAVLIPRPETEVLVDWVLESKGHGSTVVIDVGTGSGAIALALRQHRPNWHVMGSDLSEEALGVGRRNGDRLGLAIDWLRSDLLKEVPRPVDLIVANLPYVDPEGPVAPGLRFEPPGALFANKAGLALIAALITEAPGWLRADGQIFLECGFDQARDVAERLRAQGFLDVAVRQDYAGIDRVVSGRLGR